MNLNDNGGFFNTKVIIMNKVLLTSHSNDDENNAANGSKYCRRSWKMNECGIIFGRITIHDHFELSMIKLVTLNKIKSISLYTGHKSFKILCVFKKSVVHYNSIF